MNSSFLRSGIIALSLLFAVAPAMAKDKAKSAKGATEKVIATVNGKAISEARADVVAKAQTAQGHARCYANDACFGDG